MRDRLPSIHIDVGNALSFINELTQIAETLKSVKTIRGASSNDPVDLRYDEGNSAFRGCNTRLMIKSKTRVYIAVTLTGNDFTYERYCEAARIIIGPPLAIYNRQKSTRYRLTIPSKEKLEPKLPPHSAKVFKYFTAAANKSNLHPSDWRRFYRFVRTCHKNLSADDLALLLIREGFSENYSYHIVNIYEHLCDFQRPQSVAEFYEYSTVVAGLKLPQ